MFFSPLEQFDLIALTNLIYFKVLPIDYRFIYNLKKYFFVFYYDILVYKFFSNYIDIFDFYILNTNIFNLTLNHIYIPIILLIFFFFIFRFFYNLYLVPFSIIQRIFELKLNFNFNLLKQQIGFLGFKYIVFIFSIFFFILYLNLLSLLPFGIALTSHLIIILYLSLSICIGIFFEGYILSGKQFFNVFLPKSPLYMLPLLIIIEMFSYIIRMFSLAIRLVANIMAGHTLIYIISTFTLLITSLNFFFIIIGVFFIIVIMLLELGVACLQAYVFTILILIYINDIYSSH